MSSTRIYHNISKIPITSTLVLIFGNYEIYRIHKGTHPYWTPKLEAAGIVTRRNGTRANHSRELDANEGSHVEGEERNQGPIKWTNLNGVPIPTLGSLMRPFGKD